MTPAFYRPRPWWRLVLLLPVGAAGVAAWRVQREVATLRREADALRAGIDASTARRAALERERQQLETEVRQVTATRGATESAIPPAERQRQAVLRAIAALRAEPASAPLPVLLRPPPSGPQGNVYFPELFSDPHYAQAYLTMMRQPSEERYAPAWAYVRLPPAELARLKAMLIQKDMARNEVEGIMESQAMREGKAVDRNQVRAVQMRVAQTFDDEIQQTFGNGVSTRLSEFLNGSGPRQELVDKLTVRLSYTRFPLAAEQAFAMIALLNSSRRATSGATAVTDEFISSARTILKPEQMDGLLQIQAEIQASRTGSINIRSPGRTAAPPKSAPVPP